MKQIFLTFLLGLLAFSCNSHNPLEEAKLKELQQLFSSVPIYNNFKQIDTYHNIKRDIAVLSNFYQSSASYEEVKSFYSIKLIEQGWIFTNEEVFSLTGRRRFGFRKDSYQLFIEHDSRSSKESWNYAISLSWDSL